MLFIESHYRGLKMKNKKRIKEKNIFKNEENWKDSDWVEVFGVSRHRKLVGEQPSNILRFYPNHLFIKIEVV